MASIVSSYQARKMPVEKLSIILIGFFMVTREKEL